MVNVRRLPNAASRTNAVFSVTKVKKLLTVCDIMSAREPEGTCSLLASGEIVEEAYSW